MAKRALNFDNIPNKRAKKKEYWLPPEIWRIVKSFTTLYRAKSREERCYDALREWYLKYSRKERQFGKLTLKIESFYTKTWKSGKKRYYKHKFCKMVGTKMRNKIQCTRELETLWFLHHGFYDNGYSWLDLKPNGDTYVEIEKDILHHIHSNESWYKRRKSSTRDYYQYKNTYDTYHIYKKVGRISNTWGPYERQLGCFGEF